MNITGAMSMVRQPIGPTTHWSENPLVPRPIGPKTNWSEDPLVRKSVIGPKKCHWSENHWSEKVSHWSENPLVRRPIGPKTHWSDDPFVRKPTGPTIHWSENPLVLSWTGNLYIVYFIVLFVRLSMGDVLWCALQ